MNRLARKLFRLLGPLLLFPAQHLCAQPSSSATAAFNNYVAAVESRLARQHSSPVSFVILLADTGDLTRLRSGELLIEKVPTPATPDALLHHWRATAFVPGATAAQFEHLLRDFPAYPHIFGPQVTAATVLSQTSSGTHLRLRTREHHVLTVILDTTFDVTFAAPDPAHRDSISRSTRVDQISPALVSSNQDDRFLYRLNSYWSWEQRDGGLYLQLESVSLTRSIPRGLAWAVKPYIESIPRESLVFTLTSARNALIHTNHQPLTPPTKDLP